MVSMDYSSGLTSEGAGSALPIVRSLVVLKRFPCLRWTSMSLCEQQSRAFNEHSGNYHRRSKTRCAGAHKRQLRTRRYDFKDRLISSAL